MVVVHKSAGLGQARASDSPRGSKLHTISGQKASTNKASTVASVSKRPAVVVVAALFMQANVLCSRGWWRGGRGAERVGCLRYEIHSVAVNVVTIVVVVVGGGLKERGKRRGRERERRVCYQDRYTYGAGQFS